MQQETKQCQNCQKEFIIEVEDFEFYKKMKVPAPTWCPDCRSQRRMSFYNTKRLYKRTCDLCGKDILAIYSKKTKFPVYCPKCWWSDKWDVSKYQAKYDFSKSFFEQFYMLLKRVPRIALEIDYQRNVNSPYANACGALKNCYLTFLTSSAEDSAYMTATKDIRNCLDLANVDNTENSYSLFNCSKLYNSTFSRECFDSISIHFSKSLRNCHDCLGCISLKNKAYCIFNEQYSKKDYYKKIKKIELGRYKNILEMKEKSEKFFLKFPNKFIHGVKNENVTGDYIYDSKNVLNSYGIIGGENIKYCKMLEVNPVKDCHDYDNWGENAENIYEVCHSGQNINNIKFSSGAWVAYGMEYCDTAVYSNNLFGCVFVNKKSYCILNKQYTKEEYFSMVEKIKKQMNEIPYTDKQGNAYKYGEFFPPEFSPFAYNETIAQEYFPLAKEESIKQGYRWKDPEKREYQVTIEAKNLPDNINDVDNSILKEVISCATTEDKKEETNCTTAFKIIPSELEFYKKMNIPLPHYCPNCRHRQRLKHRNPLKLYQRTCIKEGCNTEFETTYAPERPEIVYCEKCYQNEIV